MTKNYSGPRTADGQVAIDDAPLLTAGEALSMVAEAVPGLLEQAALVVEPESRQGGAIQQRFSTRGDHPALQNPQVRHRKRFPVILGQHATGRTAAHEAGHLLSYVANENWDPRSRLDRRLATRDNSLPHPIRPNEHFAEAFRRVVTGATTTPQDRTVVNEMIRMHLESRI